MRHLVAVGGSGQHVALALTDLAALAEGVASVAGPVNLFVLDRDQTNDEQSPTAWQLAVRQLRRLFLASGGAWRVPADASWEIPPCRDVPGEKVAQVVSGIWGKHYLTPEQMDVRYASGYYGQAPVAAAFFDDVLRAERREQGTAVEALAADRNDRRVVVAGSLVGGTGAGCLPRLVEFLARGGARPDAAQGRPAGTDLMALALLDWFRLEGKDDAEAALANRRASAMRSRQPSALLWAAKGLAEHAATVLLADPSPGGAPARPWKGDIAQPAHVKLAVPYTAAVVASQFLFEGATSPAGTYCVACPDPQDGVLRLPASAHVFAGNERNEHALQLRNLVGLNHELCERLRWTIEYLRHPLDVRHSLFPRAWRVPLLDGVRARLDERRRQDLVERLVELADAKWDALQRLLASDPDLAPQVLLPRRGASWLGHFEATPGVPRLAAWLAPSAEVDEAARGDPTAGRIVRALVSGLAPRGALDACPSARRCLPATVQEDAGNARSTRVPGALEPLGAIRMQQLIAYDLVKPECLPSIESVRGFLASCCFAPERAGTRPGEERATWTRRWGLLLLGLCAGRLRLERPAPDDGAVRLAPPPPAPGAEWMILDAKGAVLGTTSEAVLLVPSVDAPWDAVANDPALSPHSDAARAVVAWFHLVDELARAAGEARPPWFRAMQAWARELEGLVNPQDRFAFVQVAREDHQRVTAGVTVDWNGTSRRLYLPALGPRSDADMDDLLVAFGVARPRTVALDALPAHLQPLASPERCPVYRRFGPSADGRLRRVVWAKREPDVARALRFGFFLAHAPDPARWEAFRLDDGLELEVLRDELDIVLDVIEPLENQLVKVPEAVPGGREGQPAKGREVLPDYPVMLRYADLVDLAQPPPRSAIAGGQAAYTFAVKGLGTVTCSPRVGGRRTGTYLLWPKFRTAAGPTCFKGYLALADSDRDGDEAWFLGAVQGAPATLDWERKLASRTQAQPLYVIRRGRLESGGVPALLTVAHPRACPEGIGLFGTGFDPVSRRSGRLLLDLGDSAREETWGVDFGSSSTVVAARGNGASPLVLRPEGALDQTRVVGLVSDIPLDDCSWLPTWDRRAPREAAGAGLFPTQLLLVDSTLAGALLDAVDFPLGVALAIDHGGRLSELSKASRPLRDLKWPARGENATPAQRAERRAFLLHLLELALCLRAGIGEGHGEARRAGLEPGLPASIQVTFTLPLRMRTYGAAAAEFAEDVGSVCELLGALTGRPFRPTFMWESHAGAPHKASRIEGQICAVADLGGGSLDLWGCIGRDETTEYADSYRFGGHDLVEQWRQSPEVQDVLRERRIEDLQRELQTSALPMLSSLSEVAPAHRALNGFFELATEAAARWVAALALEGLRRAVPRPVVVNLSLLGMGWSLFSSFDEAPEAFVSAIGARARQFLAEQARGAGREPGPELEVQTGRNAQRGTARKTYLACSAANVTGRPMPELLKKQTVAFLGFDLEEETRDARRQHAWHERVRIPGGAKEVARLVFSSTELHAQPRPSLPVHRLDAAQLERIVMDLERYPRSPPDFAYDGPAPFAMVLELLRNRCAV